MSGFLPCASRRWLVSATTRASQWSERGFTVAARPRGVERFGDGRGGRDRQGEDGRGEGGPEGRRAHGVSEAGGAGEAPACHGSPVGVLGRLTAVSSRADVAVIGGSGFYSFLDDPEQVEVSTPYGDPSAPVSVGEVGGRRVAFLPRHGRHHEYPPHRINYRANLWALRSLGVRQVLAPCAVGGLRAEVAPGDLVVPDQLVDRTSGRERTFVERGAVHLPFADPYCPRLSGALAAARRRTARRDDGGRSTARASPPAPSRATTPTVAGRSST